jgi:type 1 glutamine amidotransferase
MPPLRRFLTASSILAIAVAAGIFFGGAATPPAAPAAPKPQITKRPAPAPGAIKALFIAGGCCHDYQTQMNTLADGISKFANVEWTLVLDTGTSTNYINPFFDDPDWAKGYDIVIHDECSADVKDDDYIRRIIRPHFGGTGAVVLHCAMHTFRNAKAANEWREFLGVTTHEHETAAPLDIKPIPEQLKNPIMKDFPATFHTPVNDELYIILKAWPNMTPLASGYGKMNNTEFPCIWTNTYGKGRVFGTTLGHDNAVVKTDTYTNLVARGLLWAAHKLDDNGNPTPDVQLLH